MKKTKYRKENKRKDKIKPRFDKIEINKLKKNEKSKGENIHRLKKKVEAKQNKKYRKEMKKENFKTEEKNSEITRRKRMKIWIALVIIVSLAFIARIAWLQFVMGDELKQMALEQQSLDRAINPRRGTIYDSTGKTVLAISSTVNTITVNPNNIAKEDKEKVVDAIRTMTEQGQYPSPLWQ